jgi:hypothetical protein
VRRYFIFATKKCRIYAALGVSQTPKKDIGREEDIQFLPVYLTPFIVKKEFTQSYRKYFP